MLPDDLLMYADSEHDANMLYAVGMFVPDPFLYLRLRGKCHILMNDLELGRARKQAAHCRVLSLSQYERKLKRKGIQSTSIANIVRLILKERGIKKVYVPATFPHGLARQLRRLKIKLRVKEGNFFPEREVKSPDEVKKISAALMMAEVGLAEGIQALRAAKIAKDGRLLYHSVPLTAEKLRAIIDISVIQAGGLANHTIVACGKQACDPHERGHGPLRAHQPIVIDIFPRSQKTGYFGDITRTVVRGRAPEALRKLYATVAHGQQVAFDKIKENVSGLEVHRNVQRFFNEEGYKTSQHNGCMQGFFHGTGHGLGLEVHEPPRMSVTSRSILKSGNVVTVEPGLYYPQLKGGVRLEDVALISEKGCRNLTKFEKVLEI